MQTQELREREEETKQEEMFLSGTVRALKEARIEMATVSSVVHAQGEVLARVQQRISQAELTLKRASKSLSRLLTRSKRRKILSVLLLSVCALAFILLAASAMPARKF